MTPEQPSFGLSTTQTSPDPSLSAEDVVRIQMRALQTNGAVDQGIRTTGRFASPGNKPIGGPTRSQPFRRTPGGSFVAHGDRDCENNPPPQAGRQVPAASRWCSASRKPPHA
jgi:hypothetical protein